MSEDVRTPRYQKIKDACRATGLSQYYLRKGCIEGTVPHIRSGRVYYVDVHALTMMPSAGAELKVSSEG